MKNFILLLALIALSAAPCSAQQEAVRYYGKLIREHNLEVAGLAQSLTLLAENGHPLYKRLKEHQELENGDLNHLLPKEMSIANSMHRASYESTPELEFVFAVDYALGVEGRQKRPAKDCMGIELVLRGRTLSEEGFDLRGVCPRVDVYVYLAKIRVVRTEWNFYRCVMEDRRTVVFQREVLPNRCQGSHHTQWSLIKQGKG